MTNERHWNDEMIALEKANSPSVESWDWRWRAEEAEAKVKKLEEELMDYEILMEQTKIGLYQMQTNFQSMQKNTVRLLERCHKLLDPKFFYYDLDPNPLVRKRQIEERTQAKNDLVHALDIFLKTMKEKRNENG
jgi:hypothetical protein